MKKIAKFQYITNDDFAVSEQVKLIGKSGAPWIQLRIKDRLRAERELPKLVELSKGYNLTVIINDYVDLVKELGADGVHLGKGDVSLDTARELLGSDKIIGATINSPEDLTQIVYKSINYFGLGPFRYTSTKKNLSPILGLEGIKKANEVARTLCPAIPIVSIGGINPEDAKLLVDEGVYGIAASTGVTRAAKPEQALIEFLNIVNESRNYDAYAS